MEATDPGAGGGVVVGRAEDHRVPDEPGDPNGPEGHQDLGSAGEAGAAETEAPEPVQAPHTLRPGGDAMPWPGGQAMPGLGGNTVPGPGGHVAPGPGGTPPRAQEDTSGHDLVDMLHWDLVAMCCPWPEDQEATFSICILFEERRGIGPGRNGPTVDIGMERKQSAWG